MLKEFVKACLKVSIGILIVYLFDFGFESLESRPMNSWWIGRSSLANAMANMITKMFPSGSSAQASSSTAATLNAKCRNAKYPRTDISRFNVPDQYVKWEIPFPGYNPTKYESESIKGQPWADPDEKLSDDIWNNLDKGAKVDRRSHTGPYKVVEGVPQNPVGRTGMIGRGLLGRWGPNHAADPIVTRWKHEHGKQAMHSKSGKPILEFVCIQRKDSGDWAIPGGMVDPGELVTTTLKREFEEEALNSLERDEKDSKALQKKIDNFFRQGFEIYRGYVDDPRNTDNAWMETVAYNFHDKDGSCVGRLKLHAGDDAVGVKWMAIDHEVKLYASHSEMIHKVADHHNAHW